MLANLLEIGKMVRKTEKETKNGKTALSSKGAGRMTKKLGLGTLENLTDTFTADSGPTINLSEIKINNAKTMLLLEIIAK